MERGREVALSYLDEPDRRAAAESYVLHELRKARTLSPEARAQIKSKIQNRLGPRFAQLFSAATERRFRQEDGNPLPAVEFWQLFHALSCGWHEKKLWNALAEPSFAWECRLVEPLTCHLESPHEWAPPRPHDVPGTPMPDVLRTAKELVAEGHAGRLRDYIDAYQSQSQEVRENDPLIGRQHGLGILVHDGNGRLQIWAARYALGDSVEDEVRMWVGTQGGRAVSREDWDVREEAKRNLFPKVGGGP